MNRPRSSRGAAVHVANLHKRFDERVVLSGLDLHVEPGELVAVVGRSGCGKSTLLRVLSGLELPTAGLARVADGDARAAVRLVFQEPRLLPWKSVIDNVCIGMSAEHRERARGVLASVGLLERARDYPGVLSGGQRQRVALARALVHEPSVLLLDEPFGALDALSRIEAQGLVERLWCERGFTAILVTHDVSEAVRLADRVLLMDRGAMAAEFAIDVPRARRREHPEVARVTSAVLDAIFGTAAAGPAAHGPVPLTGHAVELCGARGAVLPINQTLVERTNA